MAAPTPKKEKGGCTEEQAYRIATEEDDIEANPTEAEHQYYWLQLLEFKVLPRIQHGSAQPHTSAQEGHGVVKTTADSVRVVVHAPGKRTSRRRVRTAAAAVPPGSNG